MKFIRVFTDEEGVARFEAIDALHGEPWSAGFAAAACQVREMAPGTVLDWHPAPRRQVVIHLSGQLEIELRDGTKEVFGPGDARLMDDLTGSGHLTSVVGTEPVVQAVVALAGDGQA